MGGYHSSVSALKGSVVRSMTNLDPREAARAVQSFWRRVEAVIIKEGYHYE